MCAYVCVCRSICRRRQRKKESFSLFFFFNKNYLKVVRGGGRGEYRFENFFLLFSVYRDKKEKSLLKE